MLRNKYNILNNIFIFLLKDGILHNEGKFLNFWKNGPKKFPTRVEKKKRFKNWKVF